MPYLCDIMYKFLRSALFRFDAENVHHWAMGALGMAVRTPLVGAVMSHKFSVRDKSLERTLFGLRFPNPVGLGAGFDKNARYLKELSVRGALSGRSIRPGRRFGPSAESPDPYQSSRP